MITMWDCLAYFGLSIVCGAGLMLGIGIAIVIHDFITHH